MGWRVIAVAVASASLALPAGASGADAGATLLLSRPSGLGALPSTQVNNSFSGTRAASGNGRLVVFSSRADGLSPDDRDQVQNVYVRDTQDGVTELVSRSTGGAAADGDSFNPTISSDGTHVAYESRAGNLDPAADPGEDVDIYLYDRAAHTTLLVSRATTATGDAGDAPSDHPSLSADGRQIAFASDAANLSTADADAKDVFIRDLAAVPPSTRLVSRATGTNGAVVNADSDVPSVDSAGTHVAFSSLAALVTPADANTFSDVYVRDLSVATPQTELISRGGTPDAVANGASFSPAISGNADRVAFITRATNFNNDNNARDDVHVRDRSSNTTSLISRADGPTGAVGNGDASPPDISASGAAVAFASSGTNLVAGLTTNTIRVYVRRPGTGSTVLASRDTAGQPADTSFRASVSSDGSSAVFQSNADGLSDLDDDDFEHVYLRRLSAGVTEYVDRPSGTGAFVGGAANSFTPGAGRSLSADGRYVVFGSESNSFFPGAADDAGDQVYRRDIVTGETVLVSRANGADGAPASSGAENPTISADGSRVAFDSTANLVDGDTDGNNQVFVRDIAAGTTVMASRADGPDGTFVGGAGGGVISGDGNHVAFATFANWIPGDIDGQPDILVRDLTTAATALVSRADGPDGANAPGPSRTASIDQTGDRIAFESDTT